jgi:hypothetical protein
MPRKMGPLAEDHPLVTDKETCSACKKPFETGQFVTLTVLGPGDSPDAQRLAHDGHAYNAVAQPVHWACATGEID